MSHNIKPTGKQGMRECVDCGVMEPEAGSRCAAQGVLNVNPSGKVRTLSLRLPEDLAADATLVARVEKLPLNVIMALALDGYVRRCRAEPDFQQRLRQQIADDQRLLADPT